MFYYETLVSSPQYHGIEMLTYQSEVALSKGIVVTVPLRAKSQLAIVMGKVSKPDYATKPITLQLTQKPLPQQLLQTLQWMQLYYPSPLGLIAQQALPSGLLRAKPAETPKQTKPTKKTQSQKTPTLSPQQQAAFQAIRTADSSTVLVHGDTGTGKTRLYIELVQDCLRNNRSALILTPEIGLTPQLVERFEDHFTEEVIVMHSHQTPAQRRKQWLRVLYAEAPQIIIGPRSALFAPIANLGIVIVDEAHEQAYKQEQAPRYHALRVAATLARQHNARLIIGSATLPISEYWMAEQTKTPIIRLDELPGGKTIDRAIELVNLKDRDSFTKSSYLSQQLIQAIETALGNKQQSLVFLNRRGTARLILCQNCGWNALCPHCDLPLTYHGDTHRMLCHTCGYYSPTPSSCPSCQSADIIFRSIGTKSIESDIKKLFPHARVKRFDTDNLTDDRLESHFTDIHAGEVDIIIGTQMIAKGLDLPKLAVVGVVIADTSLYLPDFSAEERTFQLLTQVIGRVGRGHVAGKVVIQSYQPDSPSIQAAVRHDWSEFYQQQLDERSKFLFPPFVHLLQLTCGRVQNATAESAARKLATDIQKAGHPVSISGPSPAFREKQNGKYFWQLTVKSKQRQILTEIVADLPSGWTYDLDPTSLL